MTRLILIRHGETEYNVQKRYSGVRDISLNESGRRHALLLHQKLASWHVDVCYASDKKRALETAGIVFPGREIVSVPEIAEINFGVFEGLNHAEIMSRYKDAYVEWMKDPYSASIPQGERLVDFERRVRRAFEAIVERHRQMTVAVVSHGGVISAFLNALERRRAFWEFIPRGTSVSVVEFDGRGHRIVSFDDHSHLDG